MLRLNQISITQYKNYTLSTFKFNERLISICGLNGKGKTNLLDAIYYLCFTKSYFNASDVLNVQFNKDGFRLEALFNNQKVVCINRGAGKKELWLNDVQYEKFSSHIGKFPAVMIAPDDIELITGGSEVRRRYIDTTISQINSDYLQQLIVYNKILLQRNSLLKRFAEQGKINISLLEVLDQQLIQPCNYIYQQRVKFTTTLLPLVQQFYAQIAGIDEAVLLNYESQLHQQQFESLLLQCRDKDILLQRSSNGIHKDDLSIQLAGQVFKNIASQGQRKSLLFALKLAEFELLKSNKGFAPLLLLDDIFEKLDTSRMKNLLQWVCIENDGQVIITDTHKERLEAAFTGLNVGFELIEL